MIDAPDTVTDALTSSGIELRVSVDSWRAGDLLAADLPIATASEEGDRSAQVPQRVTFTLPRVADGFTWAPGSDADHPLAANGQQLHVKLGVGTVGGQAEYFQRGVFLIVDTDADGDLLTVDARNLLQLVDEAKLISPFQPSGTLGSTLRNLIEPGLTVDLTSAPTDRSVPAAVTLDNDRLQGMYDLLDAWAAEGVVTEDGYLQVSPALQTVTAVATLTDGVGGTVVRANGSSSRTGGFNVVVARGQAATDGAPIQGVAYDTSSNRNYNSPWSPYPVPFEFFSPLLTTVDQCTQAARTILARKMREAGATFNVEMVPNPLLQLGDGVQLETGAFSGLCTIEEQTLPYRAADGGHAMTLTVREVLT